MIRNLKDAQKYLTQPIISEFWTLTTQKHPHMCINGGVKIDFHNIQKNDIFYMAQQLTKCRQKAVATPVYEYNFDPTNELPHHISALTLVWEDSDRCYLNFFNPKGKGSPRKKEEKQLLQLLARLIQKATSCKTPPKVQIYLGKNIQSQDEIGLCQLYSLYYLSNFLNKPSHVPPETFLQTLKPITRKKLLDFWCQTFGRCDL